MFDFSSYCLRGPGTRNGGLVSLALVCVLLVWSLSCGSSSHLQSIQISTPSPQGFDVINLGGTVQLVVTGVYSNGHTKDLTDQATYQITVTASSVDQNQVPLPKPPAGLAVSPTGLLTAEYPGICTWVNLNASSSTATAPVWSMSGSYTVTAADDQITSPPVYVAVASAVGIIDMSNPNGFCGPQPSS
jgi:hypothetical protein